MIHLKNNTTLFLTNRIVSYLIFIVMYLFISINVMAKSAFSRGLSNCSVDKQDSTKQKEKERRVSQNFVASNYHEVEHTSVLLPDNEITDYLTDWELKKSSEDISIYCQWIQIESNKKTRRLRGAMIVKAPVPQVVALIKSETKAKDWIFGARNYFHINIIEDNCWYSYVEFHFPWPIPDYDIILKNNMISDPQKRTTIIVSQSVSDLVPERNGIKRFPHFHGVWKLESLADGRTSIKLTIFTKMNPNVPKWISDPIIINGLLNTLRRMHHIVSNPNSLSYGLNYPPVN